MVAFICEVQLHVLHRNACIPKIEHSRRAELSNPQAPLRKDIQRQVEAVKCLILIQNIPGSDLVTGYSNWGIMR